VTCEVDAVTACEWSGSDEGDTRLAVQLASGPHIEVAASVQNVESSRPNGVEGVEDIGVWVVNDEGPAEVGEVLLQS
jgi:hypothetical protein